MVSNSRRMPEATPAASFISRAISSKKRLGVWVIAGLGFGFKMAGTRMVTVCSARKGGRNVPLLPDHWVDLGIKFFETLPQTEIPPSTAAWLHRLALRIHPAETRRTVR